jgi:protein phosphatase
MPFWEKLVKLMFSETKETPGEETGNCVEETGDEQPMADGAGAPPEALELEICLQSDLGSVRANNEDRGVYECPSDRAVAAAKGTLVIVADGMGGASAGEVASEMAVRSIPRHYYDSTKGPALALKEALEEVSAEIHRAGQEDPGLRGMGTTCVALAILLPELYAAYVGDSRLYLLRGDGFYQLTEDHTVVGEMVRKGILTREQARNHEERNVLSLSMGGRPEITASYWEKPMPLRAGDRLLVCSDGLHDLVGDGEMQAILASAPLHQAVDDLIAAAKRRGGHDNITVALVHVRLAEEGEPPAREARATREIPVSPQ